MSERAFLHRVTAQPSLAKIKITITTTIRAAFTYEPFLSSKKSIATHHARQRSSILQHEIPHSRMLVRPYGHSQTPICPGIWGINSS